MMTYISVTCTEANNIILSRSPFRGQQHIRPLVKEKRKLFERIKDEPERGGDDAPVVFGGVIYVAPRHEKRRKHVREEGEDGQRQIRRLQREDQQRPYRHGRRRPAGGGGGIGDGGGGGGGG